MANTTSNYKKSTHKRIALADQLDALQQQLSGLKHVDAKFTQLSPLKVGSR